MKGLLAVTFCMLATASYAQACPNQSTTITIPVTGSATIVPVDGTTCNALDPTVVTAVIVNGGQVTLTPTTKPAMTTDSSGVHLSANGLAFGSQFPITFSYAAKSFVVTAMIGGPVTPVATTTTP